jgi:WD40 repeat protein
VALAGGAGGLGEEYARARGVVGDGLRIRARMLAQGAGGFGVFPGGESPPPSFAQFPGGARAMEEEAKALYATLQELKEFEAFAVRLAGIGERTVAAAGYVGQLEWTDLGGGGGGAMGSGIHMEWMPGGAQYPVSGVSGWPHPMGALAGIVGYHHPPGPARDGLSPLQLQQIQLQQQQQQRGSAGNNNNNNNNNRGATRARPPPRTPLSPFAVLQLALARPPPSRLAAPSLAYLTRLRNGSQRAAWLRAVFVNYRNNMSLVGGRGAELLRLDGHDGCVGDFGIEGGGGRMGLPSGRRLVSGSADKTAIVWDAATGAQLTRLKHRSAVVSVSFGREGELVTAQAGRVFVWSREYDLLSKIDLPDTACIVSVRYSEDGSLLSASCTDKRIRVWKDPRLHNDRKAAADGHGGGTGGAGSVSRSPSSKLLSGSSRHSRSSHTLPRLGGALPPPMSSASNGGGFRNQHGSILDASSSKHTPASPNAAAADKARQDKLLASPRARQAAARRKAAEGTTSATLTAARRAGITSTLGSPGQGHARPPPPDPSLPFRVLQSLSTRGQPTDIGRIAVAPRPYYTAASVPASGASTASSFSSLSSSPSSSLSSSLSSADPAAATAASSTTGGANASESDPSLTSPASSVQTMPSVLIGAATGAGSLSIWHPPHSTPLVTLAPHGTTLCALGPGAAKAFGTPTSASAAAGLPWTLAKLSLARFAAGSSTQPSMSLSLASSQPPPMSSSSSSAAAAAAASGGKTAGLLDGTGGHIGNNNIINNNNGGGNLSNQLSELTALLGPATDTNHGASPGGVTVWDVNRESNAVGVRTSAAAASAAVGKSKLSSAPGGGSASAAATISRSGRKRRALLMSLGTGSAGGSSPAAGASTAAVLSPIDEVRIFFVFFLFCFVFFCFYCHRIVLCDPSPNSHPPRSPTFRCFISSVRRIAALPIFPRSRPRRSSTALRRGSLLRPWPCPRAGRLSRPEVRT